MQKNCFILGVAGGSGSGKTYFAEAMMKKLNLERGSQFCDIVYQDNFYIDQSSRFDFDGGSVNFDHPNSIDFSLLAQCLKQLKSGEPAAIPTYDFATHKRTTKVLNVNSKSIIIVDGILIFHSNEVRQLFDDLVYFDTPEDLRFNRRLVRDVEERGRTFEGVRHQFYKQVKPMHDEYVEPSKKHARTVVYDLGHYEHIFNRYFQELVAKTF